MVGLTFFEQLSLSYVQWGAILLNMTVWLTRTLAWWKKAVLVYSVLLVVFWGDMPSVDVRITWNQIPRLAGLSPQETLDTLPSLNYLKYQPPAWTLFLNSIPSYRYHQLLSVLVGGLVLSLLVTLHGETLASLWAATPLVQLMTSHPSNDLYAVCFLLCALRCVQLRRLIVGMGFLIIACCTKYTTLVLLPFLLPSFGTASVLLLPAAWLYWSWGRGTFWGTIQGRYLLHSFSMGMFSQYRRVSSVGGTGTPLMGKVLKALTWRATTVTRPAGTSLWFYLFPAYTVRWRWIAYLVCAGLLFGYGNIKYLILVLPVFVVSDNEC